MSYQNKRRNEDRLQLITQAIAIDGRSVLDLGCAEGYFCIELAKSYAAKCLGIDECADEIAVAREVAKREHADSATFHVGKWESTTIEAPYYYVVLFLSMLHYYPNDQKPNTVREVANRASKYAVFEWQESGHTNGDFSVGQFCEVVFDCTHSCFSSVRLLGTTDVGRRFWLCTR